MPKILVTGGSGYIGSHTVLEILPFYDVVVVDNLVNSCVDSLNRVEKITGKSIEFIYGDICDYHFLKSVFDSHDFDAVIHFSGLKSVSESVQNPLEYYKNNVCGSISLLKVMELKRVKKIIFSSSATVYGTPVKLPITESMSRSSNNPYGQSKLSVEYILEDLAKSSDSWDIVNLRYFNPVGAHSSGLIGEDPTGFPNNLMPFINQVALGLREKLSVFGGDYDTADGTGVRDYIHVTDLAKGHLASLDYLLNNTSIGFSAFNLGTGYGISVLEMVSAFEKFNNITVPYEIVERRSGDVAICFSDPSRALKILNWRAELGLEEMCVDSWNWQLKNPKGYC